MKWGSYQLLSKETRLPGRLASHHTLDITCCTTKSGDTTTKTMETMVTTPMSPWKWRQCQQLHQQRALRDPATNLGPHGNHGLRTSPGRRGVLALLISLGQHGNHDHRTDHGRLGVHDPLTSHGRLGNQDPPTNHGLPGVPDHRTNPGLHGNLDPPEDHH